MIDDDWMFRDKKLVEEARQRELAKKHQFDAYKQRMNNIMTIGIVLIIILVGVLVAMVVSGDYIRVIPTAPPTTPRPPQQSDGAAAPVPSRDNGYDDWLPTHMAPTATAQAEQLEQFYENHPDYTPAPTWSPPPNLPTVTPVPQEAVLVALPAPQWNCGCINGQCEWVMVPIVGDYVDANLNLYAWGIPENGVIDMRDYLVGTPGARPEGYCTP
jgi:hypothetical protein